MESLATAMMAEVKAEPPNTAALPEELIIEILSRVEFSNTLQLRCVCKRWKSLVVDPEFCKKHFQNYLTNINVLASKAMELYDAFISQHNINNQEQDEEAEDAAEEEEDEDAAEEEDNDEEEDEDAAEEEEDAAEEEEDDDDDDDAAEEEEDDDEEEDGDDDVAAAAVDKEEDKLKQLLMNIVAQVDSVLVNIRSIKEKMVKLDTNKVDMQTQALEDIIKCFRSFMRIYLKSATSSSS